MDSDSACLHKLIKSQMNFFSTWDFSFLWCYDFVPCVPSNILILPTSATLPWFLELTPCSQSLFALQALQETGLQLLLCCWLPSLANQQVMHSLWAARNMQTVCSGTTGWAEQDGLLLCGLFYLCIELSCVYSAELVHSVRNSAHYLPVFFFTC